MRRREFLATAAAAVVLPVSKMAEAAAERHLLYIAEPGIRNYVEYGGVGVLVYDIGASYKFVKRIPTWTVPAGQEPENVKGVAASAKTGRIFVTTIKRMCAIDLVTEKIVWEAAPEGGCDRLAISPDGTTLYVPSLEGPHWHVMSAQDGSIIKKIVTDSGAHNTAYSLDGSRAYLAGLRSPLLSVADTKTHTVTKTVGPFGNVIRPFTVNGAGTRAYVNVNELLGFEIGDITTGQGAAPGGGQGIREGSRQAAWLPEPRRRTHARRDRALAVRRPQQRRPHLRQHRDAAETDVDDHRARSARLGDVQHRRETRVSIDRRGVRYPLEEADCITPG